MSAPPLPDAFGNYALGDFVEVASPPAISWLPQTPGWYWIGAGLLALGLWRGGLRLRHWYRDRYRREARRRLSAMTVDTPELATRLNELLKLTALVAYPRTEVARLSGSAWTDFLNSCCDETPFAGDAAGVLAGGIYRGARPDAAMAGELLQSASLWIDRHRRPADA